jgi:hypothetical protein
MPKIPIMGGTKKEAVGTQMPTLELNRAGIVAGALSGLGGQLSDIGVELYKRRQKEELLHWGAESFAKFDREMNQKEMALKQKYAGTDYSGYAQEYDKVASETKQQYLNSANSDAKRKFFDDKTQGYIGDKLIYSDKYENEEKRNFYINATANRIEKIGGDGKYVEANRALQEQEELIKNSEYFSNDAREKLNEQLNKVAVKTVDSMIIQKNTKAAVMLLDGKDLKNSEHILKRLTPYEKEQLKAKAVNSEMTLKNDMFRNVLKSLSDAEIALQSGEKLPNDEDILAVEAKLALLPEGLQEEARAKFAMTKATVEAQKSFALLPDHQRNIEGFVADQAEKLKFTDSIEAAAFRGKLKQKVQTLSSHLDTQYQKDPTKYLMAFDPELSNLANQAIVGDNKAFSTYKAKLDSYYDQRGEKEANRKYASPEMREYFAGQFKTIFTNKPEKGDELAKKLFDDFEKMAGDDAYGLMRELKIPEQYSVVGEIKNPVNRLRAIQNIMFPTDETLYKNKVTNTSKSDEVGELMANPLFEIYAQIGNPNDGSARAEAMKVLNSVHAEYRRLRLGGTGKSKARQEAWAMFSETFKPSTVSYSSVMLPVDVPNHENIENFMEHTLKTQDSFIQSHHRWVSTADRKGIILYAPSNEDPAVFKKVTEYKFSDINKEIHPTRNLGVGNYAQRERERVRAKPLSEWTNRDFISAGVYGTKDVK